jgi:hypothetical protein
MGEILFPSNHMKTAILLLGMFLGGLLVRLPAGPVSLQPDEIVQLRGLVATNAAAASQFSILQRRAEAALGDAPHPLEKVVTEGRLDNDPAKLRTLAALVDLDKIEALAWVWAVTADPRCAHQARVFILAWAQVNRPDGDPINETRFEPLIAGYDLLRGTFSEGDRRRVDDWLRHKAIVLAESRRKVGDNWYSHRLKVVGLIAWTIDDPALIADTVAGFHEQINHNLRANGAASDFYQRDALHYQVYDLEPLLTLARTADRAGQDFFDYAAANGATLKRGVDFVVPFANGTKTHVEFVNSKVPFDRKRAQNGQSLFQPHVWEPAAAATLFSQAAWFGADDGRLAARLAGHPGETCFNWLSVINAVSRHGSGHR